MQNGSDLPMVAHWINREAETRIQNLGLLFVSPTHEFLTFPIPTGN